uniref:CCHC-type domain-containing protein n=1 Tax=Oncorhynchus tshawytscha TaxID=74940 RepID=A0A8C8FCN7_ONCTS
MTRWARANNVHKHKPAEATPWSQLRTRGGGVGRGRPGPFGGSGGASSSHGLGGWGRGRGGGGDPLRRTQLGDAGIKKPCRKKKDYDNEDVNGFMEYLQSGGAGTSRGGGGAGMGGLREEVETALKKDRRREDRRIKRQDDKKSSMVCFNCRKPGHGLADCPEADRDEEMGREICYRCGSTEHEIQRCRAKIDPALGVRPWVGLGGHTPSHWGARPSHWGARPTHWGARPSQSELVFPHIRALLQTEILLRFIGWLVSDDHAGEDAGCGGEYPYAKCFICSKTGHLSRSCPDNPKGLYAAGGCCRVCGSVEHFQKDCPEHQAASNQVTLGWLSNNMSADHEEVHVPVKKAPPKRAKVVVF